MFIEIDTLTIGVADAVVVCNTGNIGRVKILEILCASVRGNCEIGFKCLDKGRTKKVHTCSYSLR